MFLAAKTFSVHRRVHNHFTKRILNLILNRKKFLRRRKWGFRQAKSAAKLPRALPAAQEAFYNAFAEPRLFVHPSIRQVRLGIGHKFVDGIGKVVGLI